MALLVANTPPRRIGRALSIAQTGSLIGQTMGPAAGAMLAGSITRPHWLFWASGALLLVAGTLVAFFVQEVKRLAPGRWRLQWLGNLREIAAAPRVKPLFLLSFLFAMLWGGSVPIMSLYVLDLLQRHPGQAARRPCGLVRSLSAWAFRPWLRCPSGDAFSIGAIPPGCWPSQLPWRP
jgi:MFS family permease